MKEGSKVPKVPRVPKVRGLLGLALLVVSGCQAEPQTWARLQKSLPGLEPAAREAAIEQFIAAKGGTPIVENQARLIFLAGVRREHRQDDAP